MDLATTGKEMLAQLGVARYEYVDMLSGAYWIMLGRELTTTFPRISRPWGVSDLAVAAV